MHVPSAGLHFHETNSALNKAAGEEAAFAKGTGAIQGFGGLAFAGNVEGLEVFAFHELEGLVVELGIGLYLAAVELVEEAFVKGVQQVNALVKGCFADRGLDVGETGHGITNWHRSQGGWEESGTGMGLSGIDVHAARQGALFAEEMLSPSTE